MHQTKLFTKTKRETPKDETSINAKLLIRGGFIHKEMAGVYSFLPLGLIVLNKIIQIIREEMNAIGGQEILMSSLQDPAVWKASGRWDDKVVDSWFKTKLVNGSEVGLSFTHEEPLARLMTSHINSYKDLPCFVYQFQTKYRNEKRAQGGLLRTREFMMKDLYSFTADDSQLDEFYELAKQAYTKIFDRLGIGEKTYFTLASGGSFSKYSHEYQTVCEAGEDRIYIDKEKGTAINKEIYGEEGFSGDTPKQTNAFRGVTRKEKDKTAEFVNSIEVGNIFKQGTRFTEPMRLFFTDEDGSKKPVIAGAYGIGVGRLMGTIVELCHDENGIIWPENIAPFKYHILCDNNHPEAVKQSNVLYAKLISEGNDALLDDREESLAVKIKDADLIGCPTRIIVSEKSLRQGGAEVKKREESFGETPLKARDGFGVSPRKKPICVKIHS
ncbi:His/Gly/Thr/Pro-type tRNA ligase C-terminal domain-containing protein [Candidatus Parcubacteria bacterium]|nr:prolyl-tRNA synthetase [Patescibacteria group bacterium]MCG2689032.1 His/Gly/Thr/Pro-type tRNA ligase C-terminal domain-containing protein [Candidatus Parcubacteria bacterium]